MGAQNLERQTVALLRGIIRIAALARQIQLLLRWQLLLSGSEFGIMVVKMGANAHPVEKSELVQRLVKLWNFFALLRHALAREFADREKM